MKAELPLLVSDEGMAFVEFVQDCEICKREVPVEHAAYYHLRDDGKVHAAHLTCGDAVNAEKQRCVPKWF